MTVADSQLHVCRPNSTQNPWPDWALQYGPTGTGGYPVSAEQLLEGMDEAGIERAAIQVPTWFCGRDAYALESAEAVPDRFAVMARPVLDDPNDAVRLRELFEHDVVKGMRATYIDSAFGDLSAESWLDDGTCDWLFELAIELDAPVMIWAPRSVGALDHVADRFPDLRIMIDQMNTFSMQPDDVADFGRSIDPVLELARHPNVGVKLRMWDWQFDEPYRSEVFETQMMRVVNTFGAQRCFWSSDFMNHRAFTPAELRDVFEKLPFADERSRELVMGDALCAWLRWP